MIPLVCVVDAVACAVDVNKMMHQKGTLDEVLRIVHVRDPVIHPPVRYKGRGLTHIHKNYVFALHRWTESEDEDLLRARSAQPDAKWSEISKCMTNRSAKQCRERWVNHVGVSPSKPWSTEEDCDLLVQAITHDNKWSNVVDKMENRTVQQIKDRYSYLMNGKKSKARSRLDFSDALEHDDRPTSRAKTEVDASSMPLDVLRDPAFDLYMNHLLDVSRNTTKSIFKASLFDGERVSFSFPSL
eukprot:3315288-Prymnesium_polylepis.1